MSRLVWDLPVRVMHWALALATAGAWLTQNLEGDWFRWHSWCGYAVLVLVLTRIAWGFVGTRHARFTAFVRGPRAALRYLRGLVRGDAPAHAGHNPLGAWMVVVLLALLLVQAVTGLFANDQIMNTGPLFGYVTGARSDALSRLHASLVNWILAAVLLHVLAVFAYLAGKRIDLITPMFTGRKSETAVRPQEAIRGSRTWLALLIAALIAGALAWLVSRAPEATLSLF